MRWQGQRARVCGQLRLAFVSDDSGATADRPQETHTTTLASPLLTCNSYSLHIEHQKEYPRRASPAEKLRALSETFSHLFSRDENPQS